MLMRMWAVAVLATLDVGSGAIAATLTKLTAKDGKTIVVLTGEIAAGDTSTLRSLIKTENDAGQLVYAIRLNSPGGNLGEGVRLAEIIRQAKISTSILNGSQCASACFVAFAAGTEKFVNYGARVGVHGASDKSGRESGDATVSMARAVKEFGVPSGIIGKMVVTPPDEMVWLSPDDLRSMGTTMTGKPVQLPSNQSNQTQLPMQTESPSAQPKKAATWEELVKGAILISAKQNNGRAIYKRVCQPELKVCINAVFFKDKDGADHILKKSEDMNGKTIAREVCEFNSHGDIRLCFNFDTDEIRRDMKDAKGDWSKIADE